MKSSIIPIFIPHLGCPNDCIFCNQRRIAKPKAPTYAQVGQEITSALCHSQMPQIAFYGGSFTALSADIQTGYLDTAYCFVKAGLADSIRVSTRPDCITEQVCKRLKAYGVKTVELGAQSMRDDILKAANRGHSANDTINATAMLKQHGFEVILQMMVGLPGFSLQTELYTARRLAQLNPTAVRIYPVCVIADTELYDMWQKGEYTALTPQSAAEICAEVLGIFEESKIDVVRIGLNPTEDLSSGGAVAGAYHPAMGQLVRSQLLFNRICAELEQNTHFCEIEISVPKGKLSLLRGQKNVNVLNLAKKYPNVQFSYCENDDLKCDFEIKVKK